jgi:flagellar hook-associated protein 3 FlgL
MRVDPNYIANLSAAIDSSSATEQRLTSQLSSGLRISTLSDDPIAVSQNVGLQGAISGIDSFVASTSGTEGRLQVTDSVLGEVVSQLTSAISLATGAGDGTLSAANLATIGQQVSQVRDSILSLANTSYQGQYLFSGSLGNTKPYTLNTATTPATAVYAGDSNTETAVTPEGETLQSSLAGSSVFTAAGSSVLGALNQLAGDLAAGTTASIPADTAALSVSLSTVSTQRSVLGSSLSRLTAASTYASTQQTRLVAQQSSLLDSDTATVATQLSTAEAQHQAIISTVAALSQNSLFSVLFK